MMLHARHASSCYNKILIASPDTDVFVIILSLRSMIVADILFLTGVKRTRRIIDVIKVADHVFESLNPCFASK